MQINYSNIYSMFLVLMACGCEVRKDIDNVEDIKIGFIEPLLGDYKAGDLEELEEVVLAHKLRGEVLGKKIEQMNTAHQFDILMCGIIFKTL